MFLLVLFLSYINKLIKMEQERQSINEIINFYVAASGEWSQSTVSTPWYLSDFENQHVDDSQISVL